jgi:hypothetical protein
MSNSFAKFGELSIRTGSSLEEDNMENEERFSTIDLNGGGPGPTFINGNANKNTYLHNSNANESSESIYSGGAYLSNGSLNGYTSFGESTTGNFPLKSGVNGLTGVNSTMFESNGLDHSSLSDSISHSKLNSTGGGVGVFNSFSHQNLTPVSTASMISTAGEASSKLALKTAVSNFLVGIFLNHP